LGMPTVGWSGSGKRSLGHARIFKEHEGWGHARALCIYLYTILRCLSRANVCQPRPERETGRLRRRGVGDGQQGAGDREQAPSTRIRNRSGYSRLSKMRGNGDSRSARSPARMEETLFGVPRANVWIEVPLTVKVHGSVLFSVPDTFSFPSTLCYSASRACGFIARL
jgi:hypothetical protein